MPSPSAVRSLPRRRGSQKRRQQRHIDEVADNGGVGQASDRDRKFRLAVHAERRRVDKQSGFAERRVAFAPKAECECLRQAAPARLRARSRLRLMTAISAMPRCEERVDHGARRAAGAEHDGLVQLGGPSPARRHRDCRESLRRRYWSSAICRRRAIMYWRRRPPRTIVGQASRRAPPPCAAPSHWRRHSRATASDFTKAAKLVSAAPPRCDRRRRCHSA